VSNVKVLGFDIPIKFINKQNFCGSHIGVYKGKENVILIDDTLEKQVKEETILHEIIEAINMNLELSLEHPQITALAHSLYQVWVDNDDVFNVGDPD